MAHSIFLFFLLTTINYVKYKNVLLKVIVFLRLAAHKSDRL